MRTKPKVHYLPANHKVWTPGCVIYLHTATRSLPDVDPEVLVLDRWAATIVDRRDGKPGQPDTRTGQGSTPDELAAWINEMCVGRTTIWLYTHTFGLDVATSRLPIVLAGLGWSVTDASVSGNAPWLRMVRGSKHLTILDSYSWLPHPLDDLARTVGLRPITGKGATRLIAPGDEYARWGCRVLRTAMAQLLDWWEINELGRWSVSGPACGWNAMRHIKPPVRPTIDPDEVGVKADRTAIYGGRRGAWIVGTRTQGPFLELDFTGAYPTVAAHLPLPGRRMVPFDSMALDNWRLTDERWGVIAEVELRTEIPRWPLRFGGATWCPTGHFRTVLAGPEIKDAMRLGCLVSVGAGYVHQLTHHLSPWALWCLALVRGDDPSIPPAVRLTAKAWSRSVIGKWATRGYTKIPLGMSPEIDWGYEEGWDHETQSRGAVVDLAGQRWWTCAAGDAEQAYPAVLAWVESETRVRLTRVIEALGAGCVLQCDTDGLIVNERTIGTDMAGGHLRAPGELRGAARTKWVLDQIDPIVAPLSLRIKAKHQTVRVLGPQHVQLPGKRKYAGLPGMATEVAPDRFTFKTMPKLSYQMSHGDARGYVRPETSVSVRGPYAPGWVTTMGVVVPPEARLGQDGVSRLLPWQMTTRKPAGAQLQDVQHPALWAL